MFGLICPLCGKRLATIHISEVDEHGQVHHLPCCRHCVERLGIELDDYPTPIAEIHQRNAQDQEQSPEAQPQAAAVAAAFAHESADQASLADCSHCGLSWQDFLKRNRFGCQHDVDTFAPQLDEALRQLHGHSRHSGRGPQQSGNQLQQRRQQRQRLQRALDQAVREEAFERAAELRDQLRQLPQQEPHQP